MSVYFGLLRMDGMAFVRSESDALIRAADYYAGLLRYIFCNEEAFNALLTERREFLRKLLTFTSAGTAALNFYTVEPGKQEQLIRIAR